MNQFEKIVFFNCSESYQKKVFTYANNWAKLDQLILTTSGSTGVPKNIKISKNQILESISNTIQFFHLKSQNTFLLALNIDFIAGQMMLYRALHLGAKLLVIEPKKDIEIPEEYVIDFAALVPMQLNNLLKSKIVNQFKTIIVGGAAVNNQLHQLILKSTLQVFQTFGMTETVSHFALRDLKLNNDLEKNPYVVLDGIKINIDERNCLEVVGNITNWEVVSTNDLVNIIDKNRFLWNGRIDRVVNSGGIKISLDYAEEKINQLLEENEINIVFFCDQEFDAALGSKIIILIDQIELKEKLEIILQRSDLGYLKPKNIYSLINFKYLPSGKIDRIGSRKLINQ